MTAFFTSRSFSAGSQISTGSRRIALAVGDRVFLPLERRYDVGSIPIDDHFAGWPTVCAYHQNFVPAALHPKSMGIANAVLFVERIPQTFDFDITLVLRLNRTHEECACEDYKSQKPSQLPNSSIFRGFTPTKKPTLINPYRVDRLFISRDPTSWCDAPLKSL